MSELQLELRLHALIHFNETFRALAAQRSIELPKDFQVNSTERLHSGLCLLVEQIFNQNGDILVPSQRPLLVLKAHRRALYQLRDRAQQWCVESSTFREVAERLAHFAFNGHSPRFSDRCSKDSLDGVFGRHTWESLFMDMYYPQRNDEKLEERRRTALGYCCASLLESSAKLSQTSIDGAYAQILAGHSEDQWLVRKYVAEIIYNLNLILRIWPEIVADKFSESDPGRADALKAGFKVSIPRQGLLALQEWLYE